VGQAASERLEAGELALAVAREAVDGHDHRQAVQAQVVDLRAQVRGAQLEGLEVLAQELGRQRRGPAQLEACSVLRRRRYGDMQPWRHADS
jgi:hypothetical protein